MTAFPLPAGEGQGEGKATVAGKNIQVARALRRRMTDAERVLWGRLRNGQLVGQKFRRQSPIGPYVVDFLCEARRLVIELDGGQHADSASDAARTARLESEGYRVIRFWNNDVLTNLDGVLAVILSELQR